MIKIINIKTIAIYRTRGAGDVFLSFKGIELLLENNCRIFYIGYGSALHLVKYFFPVITIIDIGKLSIWNSFKAIRENINELDAFVDLQKNSRSISLRILLYARYRMQTFSWYQGSVKRNIVVLLSRISGRQYQFSVVKNYSQSSVGKRMYGCMMQCIACLFGEKEIKIPKTYIRSSIKPHNDKILIIAPGGSHPAKHIPVEVITSVINNMYSFSSKSLKIFIVGDKKDMQLGEKIKNELHLNAVTENQAGKLSWNEVVALLSGACVVLSSDSAIAHLASYLDIPCVTLMGPTIEGFGYASNTVSNIVITHKIPCRPCSKNGDRDCAYNDKLCFYDIDKKEIESFIIKYLN